MEIATCKSCGRLFNVMGRVRICPACKAGLEDKFQDAKKYLDENPNTTIERLSKECEISVKQIREWIREERLSFREGSGCGINCELCGAMILTGRFCNVCKQKMHDNLSGAITSKRRDESMKRDHDGNRMRFLQNL